MQNLVTLEQLKKYDEIKGRIVEEVEDLPAVAENRIYAKKHSYKKTFEETKTPIDLVGSYFKLVSTGKYVIRDLYECESNGNKVGSIFISDFDVHLYANKDFSGLYPDVLNSQTQYEWQISESVEHFDFYTGNSRENTFIQLANYEQVDDFFIRKTEKGSAGGVATLDADGRIPIEQMNVKSLRLIGTYDCSSGVFPSTVNRIEGDYYRVSVGGTLTEMRDEIIIKANEAISLFEKNLINEAISTGLKVYIDIEGVKTAIVSVDTNKIILESSEILLPQDSDVRLYADTEFPFSWTFDVNDLIIFNAQGEWQKLKSQDSVLSVNKKTGDVAVYGDNTPIETPTSTSDKRTIKEYIDELIVEYSKLVGLSAHPIGSLYWSSDSTNPAELFGGTWQQIKDKFILAAGDDYVASETGGSSKVTLKEENLPAHAHGMEHSHNVSGTAKSAGSHGHALLVYTGEKDSISNVYGYSLIASNQGLHRSHDYVWNPQFAGSGANYIKDNGSHTHELTASTSSISKTQTEPTGSGEAIDILPPYEVAYCWKRIA